MSIVTVIYISPNLALVDFLKLKVPISLEVHKHQLVIYLGVSTNVYFVNNKQKVRGFTF